MDRAAEALLAVVNDWFDLSGASKEVVLLVGKGNKGGDALSLGSLLLQQQFKVSAILVYPMNELGALCKARLEKYKQTGGSIHPLHMEKVISAPILIDGIVGTGFEGVPDESISNAITWANAQDAAILAIHIPSGLNGTTGVVETVAISATITCCLGLPKIGCFIGQGWDYVGALLTCNIDLPAEIVAHANSTALLLKKESLRLPLLFARATNMRRVMCSASADHRKCRSCRSHLARNASRRRRNRQTVYTAGNFASRPCSRNHT